MSNAAPVFDFPKLDHQLSPAGWSLIKAFESCRLTAYLPTPHDVPTIGWGSTRDINGAAIQLGMCWTQAQANSRLAADIANLEHGLCALLAMTPTRQGAFDALLSFAYNLGLQALARSTLLALHRAGDMAGAARQFARWNRQGTKVLPGLARRRAAEAALYLGHG